MDNLYREEILEFYKNPLNFGKLEEFDFYSKGKNPFCGDEVEMFIKINKNKVKEIKFNGKGCAISIFSTSVLTEYIKGKTIKQLTKFNEKDMLHLLRIELSQTRKKCALLGLAVLKDCFSTRIIQ